MDGPQAVTGIPPPRQHSRQQTVSLDYPDAFDAEANAAPEPTESGRATMPNSAATGVGVVFGVSVWFTATETADTTIPPDRREWHCRRGRSRVGSGRIGFGGQRVWIVS